MSEVGKQATGGLIWKVRCVNQTSHICHKAHSCGDFIEASADKSCADFQQTGWMAHVGTQCFFVNSYPRQHPVSQRQEGEPGKENKQ
jgi:hypothetical protein